MKGLDSTEIDTKIEFNIAGVLNLYDGCATVELSFDPEKKRESEIRRWHDRPADSSSAGATGIHSHQRQEDLSHGMHCPRASASPLCTDTDQIQLRDYARISGCQGDVKKSGCVDMSHTHKHLRAHTHIYIHVTCTLYIRQRMQTERDTCMHGLLHRHTYLQNIYDVR